MKQKNAVVRIIILNLSFLCILVALLTGNKTFLGFLLLIPGLLGIIYFIKNIWV